MHTGFFRVPYILQGSWYLTWLTSFVTLTLVFALLTAALLAGRFATIRRITV
jgi:hypothetical protein